MAVRQLASVVTMAPLKTPVTPSVPLKYRSLKLLVSPGGFAAVPPTRIAICAVPPPTALLREFQNTLSWKARVTVTTSLRKQ